MATKIIKNNIDEIVSLDDIQMEIEASGIYTVPESRYARFASSNDLLIKIGDGTFTCNDGTLDLSVDDATTFMTNKNPSAKPPQHNNIEYSWAVNGSPELFTSNTIYTTMSRVIFRGSHCIGTPFAMSAVCFQSDATSMDIRVYDITNDQVIAEVSGIVDTTPALVSFPSIENISAEAAIWDIQLQRNGVSGEANLSAFSVEF